MLEVESARKMNDVPDTYATVQKNLGQKQA